MKKILFVLSILGLFSCSKSSRKISEPFPNFPATDVDWVTYEGILPSENGKDILVELHLAPAAPGMDSYYRIEETLDSSSSLRTPFSMSSASRGTYSVLFGSPGHNIIQIKDRTLIGSIMRGREFSPANRVVRDLFLKTYGDHELVLVDENFQESDPRYTLFRRSDLFTVEGYFTVYNDTTDYFERNTLKKWGVARLGCFEEAMTKYHLLATEPRKNTKGFT
jgi:hypothetical protein